MSTPFPRLPMLQSIGRSSGIDMEEPPEDYRSADEDQTKSFVMEGCSTDSAAVLIDKFDTEFHVMQYKSYYCNKFTNKLKEPSKLLHCWKGAEVMKHVHKMRQSIICRSQLEFMKDVFAGLEAALNLEECIKKTTLSELEMWNVVSHNRIHCPIKTGLVELSDLCDELGVQLNFWGSKWKHLFCNLRLKDKYCNIYRVMKTVRIEFDHINACCLLWLKKLVTTGFKVLAHCDLDRIEYDSLCSIAKGLEDYNRLVNDFESSLSFMKNKFFLSSFFVSCLSLSNVLELMASERSKYAAISCKEFLFGSPDFLNNVKNIKFNQIKWLNHYRINKTKKTEQYFSDLSSEMDSSNRNDVVQLLAKVSDSLLSSYSPAMDFIRREKSFIENFLHAVCHVTNLLTAETFLCERLVQQNIESSGNVKQYVANDIPSLELQPSLIPTTSQKKIVSWNDSIMVNQAIDMTNQYFAKIWESFVGSFRDFVEGFYWMGDHISCDHLGCVATSHDVISLLLSEILQYAANKGTFPATVQPYLFQLSLRYVVLPSNNAWRATLSQYNRQSSSSADGYASSIVEQLIMSLHPLMTVIQNFQHHIDFFCQNSVNKSMLRVSSDLVSWYHISISCFIFSCFEALSPCHKSTSMSLSSSRLSCFLRLSRVDLKSLISLLDEAHHMHIRLIRSLESVTPDIGDGFLNGHSLLFMLLKNTADDINCLLDNLKELHIMAIKSFKAFCFENAMQYFKSEFPLGKYWKRKDVQTLYQQSEYIEKGVEILVQPSLIASQNLTYAERLCVVFMSLHETCTAWMDHILEQKIKFSYHGACQLEKDIAFMKFWLCCNIQDSQLRARLSSASTFEYLDGIVNLLKQQPNKASLGGNNSNSDNLNNPDNSCPNATPSCSGYYKCSSKKTKKSKNEKVQRSTQEGKPKFGRSAKVGVNSMEAMENQTNFAFLNNQSDSTEYQTKNCTSPTNSVSHIPLNSIGTQLDSFLMKSTESSDGTTIPFDHETEEKVSKQTVTEDGLNGVEEMKIKKEVKEYKQKVADLSEDQENEQMYASSSFLIPKKEEWLALRVRRGNRSWPRLPMCFSGSIDSCGS